jgi:hypothetical protein
MKRISLSVAVLFVLAGVIGSVAATHATSSPADQRLAGKVVIVEAKGVTFGISENVRFESLGQHDYIVVPMQVGTTEAKHDYWLSLDQVLALRVFDSMEQAVASDPSHQQKEASSHATTESPEATDTASVDEDVPPKVVKYAVGFIKRYDANNDGVLTENEWREMNSDYSSADVDKDGRITPLELGAALNRRDGGSVTPKTNAVKDGTITSHDAGLVWQECKTESAAIGAHSIHRSKVPGGWLVILERDEHPTIPSFTFLPDPHHEWNGRSIE